MIGTAARITFGLLLVGLLITCSGCRSGNEDIRQAMLESAKKDKDFPDETHKIVTDFVYLGGVETKDGTIRIVLCRSVLVDMLAPRGNKRIYFFNAKNDLVGQLWYSTLGEPLFCEDSRLYFSGIQYDGRSEGNALELADGIKNARFVFAKRPGSWMHSTTTSVPEP